MCGIAGAIFYNNKDKHIHLVNEILHSQHHRGPDATQSELIASHLHTVILGHNRLSIIDLSTKANQPLWDCDKKYCITFNGEIYNYVELRKQLEEMGKPFRTSSDTEVILQAYAVWGSEAFSKFVGGFAFALYDTILNKLILCKDRFGKKPLYYHCPGNHLVFASSAKILASHYDLAPNLLYLSRGLKYNLFEDSSEVTQYQKLFSLLPAHYLEINLNNSNVVYRLVKYYDLHSNVANLIEQLSPLPSSSLTELVENTLNEAIFQRQRADVPLAISLSGGLDSASIAVKCVNPSAILTAFSFGNIKNKQTEASLVNQLAQQYGIDVQYVWPSYQEFNECFFQTLIKQEAPFPSLSIVAQNAVFKAAKMRNFKVLMGGQGNDEAMMGYRKYLLFYLKWLYKAGHPIELMSHFLAILSTFLSEYNRLFLFWRLRKKFFYKMGLHHRLPIYSKEEIDLNYNPLQPLWERQLEDIMNYSLPTLLRYEDRNSLAHSVESRLPFMDHRLIEISLALPVTLKIKAGYGKWILRQIMQQQLPSSIVNARNKKGFEAADSLWIKNGLGKQIREYLDGHFDLIKDYLPLHTNIGTFFSDDALINHSNAMTEATTLIWLSQA